MVVAIPMRMPTSKAQNGEKEDEEEEEEDNSVQDQSHSNV